jgi:hypothetical protein
MYTYIYLKVDDLMLFKKYDSTADTQVKFSQIITLSVYLNIK